MKLAALTFLLLGATMAACDTEDLTPKKVPVEVRQTLLNIFPNASNIEWERQGQNYEAEFYLTAVDHAALLHASGNLLMYKHQVTNQSLPEAVKTTIARKYPNYSVSQAERLVIGTETLYQVEVSKNDQSEWLVLSITGEERPHLAYWD
ncbi:hypothetical protein [uncultured Pontibacter sp.]|uniref:PepSY-like domain-containing protein n=1 Tax=uncultured Pontibacter sp. TaxID=453356 RepID=UPI00261968B3|nr:hypothetical protein [uncultured Pontibacter sp.]